MRDLLVLRLGSAALLLGSLLIGASPAHAQAAPAAAPPTAPAPPGAAPAPAPPGVAPAPPGYYAGYPPPGYPPPPGYGYAPPGYAYPQPVRAPDSIPYDGGPVPSGFHVEERPRRGLLIAGPIVLGVPWVLGLAVASGENFPNQSGWLVVPALGPWLTLATRKKSTTCSDAYVGDCVDEDLDSTTRTFLILDGLMQGAGTIMLVYGLASPHKVIARDFVGSLHFAPATLGRTGYGGMLRGEW